jgi:hypothetical protein
MDETDFSIPAPKSMRDPNSKASKVRSIAVGGSRFFPAENPAARKHWQATAATVGGREGAKFVTRAVVHEGREGLRIWRTA